MSHQSSNLSVSAPAVELSGVNQIFKKGDEPIVALENVDLEVKRGEFLTIVGPSGCGKSTVLNIIVGLISPTSGSVAVGAVQNTDVNPSVGYVTQADNLFPWRTVIQNVEFGLEMRGIGSREERRKRAQELIDRVGLTGFENHFRHELSGGMRQRVNIIRTLAYSPKVVLLDEPFGPLDAQTRLQLQDLLLGLWRESDDMTVIFITHDLSEAVTLGDRVVVMGARPGRIRQEVAVDLPRPRDIYTVQTDDRFREIYDVIWSELADEMKAPH